MSDERDDWVGPSEAAEILEPPGDVAALRHHLRHELPVIADLDLREVLGLLADQLGQPNQQPPPIGCVHAAPGWSAERAGSRLHRVVRVFS